MFEYLVAAVLRYSGYIAGVPIRRMGGRGTKHQIDVVGIEFNHLPFLYDVILILEAKCHSINRHVGIDVIRQNKSNIDDFNQTRPNFLNPLPRNQHYTEYYNNLLGVNNHEKWTARYQGAVFTTSYFSDEALEFALAHGIYLLNFPNYVNGNLIEDWLELIKTSIVSIKSLNDLRQYVPNSGEKAYKKYAAIITKLRESSYSELHPKERHELFKLIRGVINYSEELKTFRRELMKVTLGLLNGYPIIIKMSKKINYQIIKKINNANRISLEKYQFKKRFGLRKQISEISAHITTKKDYSKNTSKVQIDFEHEKVALDITAELFLQKTLFNSLKYNGNIIRIPLMDDLHLIAKIPEKGKLNN